MLDTMVDDLLILSTRSTIDYAAQVAYHLETFPEFRSSVRPRNFVRKLTTMKFADGEMEVEVDVTLRGRNVFLFANAGRNRAGLSVEENKLELYHSIDALRRAKAGQITLFEPYCSCARSDRTTRRNSVGFWVHYKTLVSLGVNRMITYQLHSDKSKTIVDPTLCAIDDVPVYTLLEEYITRMFVCSYDNYRDYVRKNWIFCSVDAGGEGLAGKYAADFGCPLMIAHKQRDYEKANSIERVNILSDTPIEGKEVWIVDDMIDTAGSVYTLVHALKERGLAKINIATVHPVFSGSAIQRLRSLYDEGLLQNMVALDTIDCPAEIRKQFPFLHIVSSARHSAEIVLRIHERKSMSPFLESFDVIGCLQSPRLIIEEV